MPQLPLGRNGDKLIFSALTFPPLPPLHLDERVQHFGQRGTIRYIGTLEGRGKRMWLGIEWDEVGRGRHDGTADGRRYFTTRKEGAGTFLKAEKLERRGVYLIEGVWRRYMEEAGDMGYRKEKHVLGGVGGVVEFRVGEFGGRIEGLERVDVGGMCVGRVGKGVGDLLKGLRELRVARSLFEDITAVGEILDEFERLEVLDLGGNVLKGFCKGEGEMHGKLKELIMNGCEVSVEGVGGVCRRAGNLREVRVYGCGLGGLEVWKGRMQRVEVLDLDRNCVGWGDVVEVLGKMESLRVLYLSGNGLRDCEVGFEGRFERLEKLSLAENELEGWRVVEGLRRVRGLKWLRLSRNGIMEKEVEGVTGRMVAIGRLGGLEVLDGSCIEKDERVYAERRYLGVVIERERRKGSGEEELKRRHGRMEELQRKYVDLLEGDGKVGGVRKGLIRVVLRKGKWDEGKSVVRWMPGRVTMEKVRAVAARLLRLESFGKMQIKVGRRAEETIEDESREIRFWLSGDDIDIEIEILCAA